METQQKPRLVILGTGFGGFSIAKRIDQRLFDIAIVSPRNHFLFTPLLPSTTVGTIEFRSIIEPIRSARPDVTYYHASCVGIDRKKHLVRCRGVMDNRRFSIPYDYLVVAVGSQSATYGVPGVREHALLLKDLGDARAIRQRVIECLEQASEPSIDPEERKRLVHFVVVGGGPTGVEFLAEMHDLVQEDLHKTFPQVVNDVRLILLEAQEEILTSFDAVLRAYTMRAFMRQGIEVKTRSIVKKIRKRSILLQNGSAIPYGLVVWSTGVKPADLTRALPFKKDAASRLVVDDYLRLDETSRHFALGDCSSVEGHLFPGTAQVAQQQGKYLAQALGGHARGQTVKPFRYRSYGMLAYIGKGKALADLDSVKGRGFIAWLFWRSVYITRLVSLKNKILVIVDWMKTFFFGRDISRF
ncbi:MAG: FAD-dependent oxidoreductase [Bacteroidota bacterium]